MTVIDSRDSRTQSHEPHFEANGTNIGGFGLRLNFLVLRCGNSEMEFGAIVQLLRRPQHSGLIGITLNRDVQAGLWHFVAEISESDASIPVHLDWAIPYYQKAIDLLTDSDDRKALEAQSERDQAITPCSAAWTVI